MMNDTMGRSVRLFLVDGNPTGLVTAEIVNWSGHVLSGSRANLPDFLQRPELDRTGIYFLFGHDPDDFDQPMLYIGESDNVRKRLAQHNKDNAKSFWERTCVVTSKDQNITKAHARYLEARLLSIANDIGKINLLNSTAHSPQVLPEADISDMEYFIEQIRLVLPVVVYDAFRAKPKRNTPRKNSAGEKTLSSETPVIFEIKANRLNLQAEGQESDGEFIVLSGSRAAIEWRQKPGHNTGYAKLHNKLLQSGILSIGAEKDYAVFTEDTSFSSPSAASAIIFGRADNGRKSWGVKGKNITYAKWQEERVDEASVRR
ncbi:MAG: GIY-YIG nuclease family protein [Rhizobiales bacterium]|nr:GIY-YIG nuclease family protein [Hyphomicrobiales bacterium]